MVGILKKGEGVGVGRRGVTNRSLKRWYGYQGLITVYRALAVCIFEVGNMSLLVWVSGIPAGIETGMVGTNVIAWIDCIVLIMSLWGHGHLLTLICLFIR